MLEIGDGTFIDAWTEEGEFLGAAQTRVRGGGSAGGRAWLARITGTHPEHGLARDFLDADKSGLSGSGRSGTLSWVITEPGLYEFRGFAQTATVNARGFAMIRDDGQVWEITRRDAFQRAAVLDAIRHRATGLFDTRIASGQEWDWDRTRRGARDALRAAVGDLAVGYPAWQFAVTVTSWAVYTELAEACQAVAADARAGVTARTDA
jgi:hypothetical protein